MQENEAVPAGDYQAEPEEAEYMEQLETERRRYAWIMQRLGEMTPAEAEAEALELYPYEGPDVDPDVRFLIFQHDAWHWAMLQLYGGIYPHDHWPGLAEAADEYAKWTGVV